MHHPSTGIWHTLIATCLPLPPPALNHTSLPESGAASQTASQPPLHTQTQSMPVLRNWACSRTPSCSGTAPQRQIRLLP
uniref:Uncharacterized protein n=1 Tax=Arundo donax TaxID=35708 RepID=A0A0A9GIJ2_ARUDO